MVDYTVTISGNGLSARALVLSLDSAGDGLPRFFEELAGAFRGWVATHRLEHEFGAQTVLEPLHYGIARRTTLSAEPIVDGTHGAEVMRRTDGTLVALFTDKWRMGTVEAELPAGSLLPMFGGEGSEDG